MAPCLFLRSVEHLYRLVHPAAGIDRARLGVHSLPFLAAIPVARVKPTLPLQLALWSCLHLAVEAGRADCLEELLADGADVRVTNRVRSCSVNLSVTFLALFCLAAPQCDSDRR